MEKKSISILFVDDEKNILNGLKRPLRSMRNEWDMDFCESGQAGLELLEKKNIDLIISDMYMPGMDGADFLQRVQTLYPHTIRTILSGHSDISLILKTLKPAHKFLHKPCPTEKIKNWVKNILFFRKILPNKELQEYLNGIGSLPSQPLFFPLLFEAIAQEKAMEVAKTIAFDVNMAANILKIVQNSFFSEVENLPSLSDAAKMLGMDLLFDIVSSKDALAEYSTYSLPDFSIDMLWRHSMRTANYARIIASMETKDQQFINKCYLAGLFHDIGKFLFIDYYKEEYVQIIQSIDTQKRSLEQLEMANLNCSHGMAGAYLLGLWGLPMDVIQAIAFHNRPSALKTHEMSPLCIVHVANVFDHMFLRFKDKNAVHDLDIHFLQQVISKEKLQSWQIECKKFFQSKLNELALCIW